MNETEKAFEKKYKLAPKRPEVPHHQEDKLHSIHHVTGAFNISPQQEEEIKAFAHTFATNRTFANFGWKE